MHPSSPNFNPRHVNESQPPKFGSFGFTLCYSVPPCGKDFFAGQCLLCLRRTLGCSNGLQSMPMRPHFPLPQQEREGQAEESQN